MGRIEEFARFQLLMRKNTLLKRTEKMRATDSFWPVRKIQTLSPTKTPSAEKSNISFFFLEDKKNFSSSHQLQIPFSSTPFYPVKKNPHSHLPRPLARPYASPSVAIMVAPAHKRTMLACCVYPYHVTKLVFFKLRGIVRSTEGGSIKFHTRPRTRPVPNRSARSAP